MMDAADRNRTSPFAFTGNKFEFRMVGAMDSVAQPNVVLNTIVAEAFKEACDEIEASDNFDSAVHNLIKKYAIEHERIVFNGDGYSEEWVKEAERRGLPNMKTMVDAIPALNTPKAVALFEKFGVFTKAELDSRVEIEYELYSKEINIEARAMVDIATKQIIPAVIRYTTVLAKSINEVKAACGADVSVQTDILMEVSKLLAETKHALVHLEEVSAVAAKMSQGREQAVYYRDEVTSAMVDLRTPVDKLEMLVDKEMWPMPSYGDLIFEV
jgi:glutamine synthetase